MNAVPQAEAFAQPASRVRNLLFQAAYWSTSTVVAILALPMLAWTIFATVDRGLGATPDVFAHPAVEFILG